MTSPLRILRLSAVKSMTGLSRSAIYRRMALDEFPKHISLGKRSVGWIESEINEWISEQITRSRETAVTHKLAA